MQSKTTRGVRRLVVSTGVISLVLSVAAPAALAARPDLAGAPGSPLVNLCPAGEVLEIEEHALDAHLGHGDVVITDDVACGEVVDGEDPVGGGTEIVDLTDPELEVEVKPGTEEKVEAEPIVIISADTVTRPTPVVPATPATPAVTNAPATPAAPSPPAAAPATSNRGNEVLGSVTTRTPSVAGSTTTVTGVTALAATGTSTTMVLAALGTVLLMAGLGLQVSARRRVRSSDVGA